MPANKLTEKNAKKLRAFYVKELTETQQFIHEVRSILARLNPEKYPKVKPARPQRQEAALPPLKRGRKPAVKIEPPKRRGRPPKAKVVESFTEVAFAPKVSPFPPISRKKKVRKELMPKVPAAVTADVTVEPEEKVVPAKKKRRWGNNYRRKGVYLTSWSKPLKKRVKELEEPEEPAQQQGKTK